MADDLCEEQVTTKMANNEQIVEAETSPTHASSKFWSDRSSDSGSTQRGSRLSLGSIDPYGIDFEYDSK